MAFYRTGVIASNTFDGVKKVSLPYTVPDGVNKMILVAVASVTGSSNTQGGNPNRTVYSTTTITKNNVQVCRAQAMHGVPQGTAHEISANTAIIDVNVGDSIKASNGVMSETGSGTEFTHKNAKGTSVAFVL